MLLHKPRLILHLVCSLFFHPGLAPTRLHCPLLTGLYCAPVREIMVHNVEQILSRGERIELLVDKTDNLSGQAWAFRRGAKDVRRREFWKNQKILALCVVVGLVSLFALVGSIIREHECANYVFPAHCSSLCGSLLRNFVVLG